MADTTNGQKHEFADDVYLNTRKPTSTPEGQMMLERMNHGHHEELANWGLKYLNAGIAKNVYAADLNSTVHMNDEASSKASVDAGGLGDEARTHNEACDNHTQNFCMLDVGCGGGANVDRLLKLYPNGKAFGVDYSEASVEYSKKTNAYAVAAGRCNIVQGDVSNLPFDSNMFDIVTAFETVYFWPDVKLGFAQVLRVLKPRGAFLVCNEADGVNDDAHEWVEIIDGMTVYTSEQIVAFMQETGFVNIETHSVPSRGWIAIVGQKL